MNEDPVIRYSLMPIDEDNPEAGYKAHIEFTDLIQTEEDFADKVIEAGLEGDRKKVVRLGWAQQAAAASLLWEGWSIAINTIEIESPWPHRAPNLLGGTTGEPVIAREPELARRMLAHDATLPEDLPLAYLAFQSEMIFQHILQNYSIESPLAILEPTIYGHFEGPEDEFDPIRHQADISMTLSEGLQGWLQGYQVLQDRHMYVPPRPILDSYRHGGLGYEKEPVRPGDPIRLCGFWLRHDRDDPRQGIYLTDEAGNTYHEIATLPIGLNNLIFVFSRDLPPGRYQVELRSVILPRHDLQSAFLPEPMIIEEPKKDE